MLRSVERRDGSWSEQNTMTHTHTHTRRSEGERVCCCTQHGIHSKPRETYSVFPVLSLRKVRTAPELTPTARDALLVAVAAAVLLTKGRADASRLLAVRNMLFDLKAPLPLLSSDGVCCWCSSVLALQAMLGECDAECLLGCVCGVAAVDPITTFGRISSQYLHVHGFENINCEAKLDCEFLH